MKLSEELIKNVEKLGLIQISEYQFKYSLESNFVVDLSASGSDEISILKNISSQSVKERDIYASRVNKLLLDSIDNTNTSLEQFKTAQEMNSKLIDKNKALVDYLLDLVKSGKKPTLQNIRELI